MQDKRSVVGWRLSVWRITRLDIAVLCRYIFVKIMFYILYSGFV